MNKLNKLYRALTYISILLIFSIVAVNEFVLYKSALISDDRVSSNKNIRLAPAEYQIPFAVLKRAAGITDKRVKLYIDYSKKTKNAYIMSNGAVVFHYGEIVYNLKFPQHLYFIMAHELMHWKHGDVGRRWWYCDISDKNSRLCEKQADLAGKRLMKKAKFNHCAGGDYWRRWLNKYGDHPPSTHPSPKQRYEYLRCR